MGFSLIKYPAIDAKLKGMYAKQLSNTDLLELIRQPDSISVISSLKTKFKPLEFLKDDATRVETEDALDSVLIEDIKKIRIYLSEEEKKIFDIFISKYEIKCLKSVLKNLISSSKIESNITDVEAWTSTIFKNIEKILNVQNVDEYLDAIKSSRYYLKISELVNKENIPIFELETSLDKEYFKILSKAVQGKSGTLKKIIGTRIDTLNLLWILRLKKFYSLPVSEIEKLLIPVNYELKKSQIKEIIEAEDYEEIQAILRKTYYQKLSYCDENDIEQEIKILLKHQYLSVLRQSKFDLSFVFAYIYLSEYQKSNIVHILGGIHYNFDKQEIEKRLII